MPSKKFPSIPEPAPSVDALYLTIQELKQAVEILAQQRKPYRYSAVTWDDLYNLGLIEESEIPT